MTKINSSVPPILKLYGKFSIHVLNEKSNGRILVEKSKKIALQMLELNKGEIEDIEKLTEPIPMVVVGAHNNEFGCIKKINLLFSSLFGYTKDDILDKNVNKIMPELYAKFHDTFIYQFLDAPNPSESDYLDKDNQFFGKGKSNYIFPMTTRVRLIRNEDSDEEIMLIGTFKTEPIIKNYIYFILDKNGVITDLSSNAMTYFNFDYNMIKKNKVKINSIAPKAIVEHTYRTKTGKDITYSKNGEEYKFNCCMETIMFRKDRENPDDRILRGFLMRMEVLVEKKYKDDTTATNSKNFTKK